MHFNLIVTITLIFLCHGNEGANHFSVDYLKYVFDGRKCIEGNLGSIAKSNSNEHHTEQKISLRNDLPQKSTSLNSHVEKTAVSRLQELAQYNKINYYFELEQEEGPAHNKVFTLKLKLGDEEYKAKDRSLKKTKQAAAVLALESTEYPHPPVKAKHEETTLTPTVLLNNFAAKLGISVSYQVITDTLENAVNAQSSQIIDERTKKSYLQRLNDSVHSNSSIHVRKDESNIQGPFRVKAQIDDEMFVGVGHSIQSARHNAAAKALNAMKNRPKDDFDCLKEGNEKACKEKIKQAKSPISQVFEEAQHRNLPVSFEIIDETGPAHKKTFTTECQLGDLKTTGEGRSKKDSKRAAAEKMVKNFSLLPEISNNGDGFKNMGQKKKKKGKKNKIIKTNFDKISMMFDNMIDYGAEIYDKMTTTNDDPGKEKKKPALSQKNLKPATEEILEIGNLLNFEIQFSDNTENGQYYSLLSMDLKPSFICFGLDITAKQAREKAAKGAINFLYKLGYLDNFSENLKAEILEEENTDSIWVEAYPKSEDKDEL